MRQVRMIVVTGVVALGLLLPAQPAWACSCAGEPESALRRRADAVFTGRVMTRADPGGIGAMLSSGRPVRWTFAVDGVEKGRVAATEAVESAADEASCGYGFAVGGRYRVFADRDGDTLTTGLCDGTEPVPADAVARGRPPDRPPATEPGASSGRGAPVALLAATGAGLLAAALLRRRNHRP